MNRTPLALLSCAALLMAGCSPKKAGGPPPGFAVPVKAARAERAPLEEKISLVATLGANEAVEIKSSIEGTIERINFEEGEAVERGRLLFTLDEGKLDAEVKQAEANFNLAEANLKRTQSMLENRTISQQEADQARANFEAGQASLELARQRGKDARITATFDGIMGARNVSPGQVVGRDKVLASLVDIDPLKVEFHVPERFLGQLTRGQAIAFSTPAYPGETFRGEVYFVDPQVDPATRTVLVKAQAPNADGRLRPGMFGNLDLILRVREDAVVVPETALVIDADRASVFIIDAEGKAQPVPVDVGVRLAGRAEILSGLAGGEQVVTEGLQKIRPGVPVRAAGAEAAPGAAQGAQP